MPGRFFSLLALFALSLSSSALLAAETTHLRSFDAKIALPAEVASAAGASAPKTLFRIKGLRNTEGETLTLDLETASIFSPDFHLYVDGRDRGRDVAARITLLRGTVEEWPGSSAVLTINSATGAWGGYLADGDQFYEVDLPAGVKEGSIAGSAVIRRTALESLPGNLVQDGLEPPLALDKKLGGAAAKIVAAPGAEYQAALAIETDYELFQQFENEDAAAAYLAGLIGNVSELYFRQIGVSLSISRLFLYTSPDDPWNAPNPHSGVTADVLCEFASVWQKSRPLNAFPRNGAMFFTGKASPDIGGQAWVGSLCNYKARPGPCPFGGYGMVVVSNRRSSDILVTAHELGHVFGSGHTHCYNPPIDRCYAGQGGCYQGETFIPAEGGSVMSYCNPSVLSLGEAGKYGDNSQRVVEVIHRFVNSVAPVCLPRTNDPYALTGEGAPGSATLSWTDPFTGESSWLVEQRLPNGKFKQVKSLPANSTGVTLTKLKPGSNTFRVRAKFKKELSDYSSAVAVTVP